MEKDLHKEIVDDYVKSKYKLSVGKSEIIKEVDCYNCKHGQLKSLCDYHHGIKDFKLALKKFLDNRKNELELHYANFESEGDIRGCDLIDSRVKEINHLIESLGLGENND